MNGILKTLSTMSKAYAFSKIMVKTGMTPPEILLFKDVIKIAVNTLKKELLYMQNQFLQNKNK